MDFFDLKCRSTSSRKKFGIVDGKPARIDEDNGANWAAVVNNQSGKSINFQAVDHCLKVNKPDGKPAKRCDGFLFYENKVIFIELKESGRKGNNWIEEAEQQLRSSIDHFGKYESDDFTSKEAIIANRKKPYFGSTQTIRMEKFLRDTSYLLEIKSRIEIE